MKAVFLSALRDSDKAESLRAAIQVGAVRGAAWHEVDPQGLQAVPRSPFCYWVSDAVRSLFEIVAPLEAPGRTARIGLSTSDDARFLRLWWAVPVWSSSTKWRRFAKGGEYASFYADIYLSVMWADDGAEMKAWVVANPTDPRTTHWSRRIANTEFFERPGLTWPLRTQRGLSFRALPRGGLFGHKGPVIFVDGDNGNALLALLAVANAGSFRGLVQLQMAFGSYEVGVIQRSPVPDLTPDDEAALAALARRAWSLKRSLDTRIETSHAFVLPALLQVSGATLAARAAAWTSRIRTTEDELAAIQAEIDERCFALYGIGEEDRHSMIEGFGGAAAGTEASGGDGTENAEGEEEAEAEVADTATLAAELVSWAVGVAFGRFDVRLATGARALPSDPEPFDPLPVCSPAMLTGADGLPLDAPPAGYPISFPGDGILVDDPGHPQDLTAAVRAIFDTVFGPGADATWQEAGGLLDPKGHDVSTWLRGGFFDHHLRRHSKSRRKAPIVWQLGTSSGRFSIWCYAHRLTRDSLFAIQNDIAAPRLAVEERRLASLRTQAGTSPSARGRAEIDAAEAAVDETRSLLAEIRRVAPLWNPDLDDGIVLVSAPLRRLVPGHRPWQKELKARWDELSSGKYDWAHLAMHLWPERVVPKCATDRSLAIAHGLEDVFWAEGSDGKWTRRSRPTMSVEELVGARTSPAVKAALTDLQAAPALAGGGRGRGRGS